MRFSIVLLAALFTSTAAPAGDGGVSSKKLKACYRGGCSGELCTDRPGANSPCLFKSTYPCLQRATCERQADGGCDFTPTAEVRRCLKAAEKSPQADVQ